MATPDMDVIKEIPGYKVILKAVLKSQIQQLVEQLASTTDEESVILTASVADGTLCHLGSDSGKVFLEDHEDIKSQFLGFCLKRHHKQKQEKERQEALEREEALARSMAPVTPPRYGGPRFMPHRSPRYPSPQQGLHPIALSRASPGGRMRSPGVRHQPYPMTRPPRPSLNLDQPQGPGPRIGNKIDGQIIKIEPDDDDEKSNQSVNDTVQTPSSVPGNSAPSSPSTKPSTPSQAQGPPDNDDAKSESSSSTIPNEASDLKYSDTVPPGGLSLDSDLSNLISNSASDSNVQTSANSQDSTSEAQTSSGLDPNVSVKLEAMTESEMDLEITGVELGQGPMQDPMGSQDWMSNVQNVMQGASGSASDMSSQQSYSAITVWKPGSQEFQPPDAISEHSDMVPFPQNLPQQTQQELLQYGIITKYQCRYCRKFIRSNADLIIHERSHTGEKPFVCIICNKGFSKKSNLKAHRVTHLKKDF